VPKKCPSDALHKYGLTQYTTGKSITELEIIYAVLNNPSMKSHSFFYFRDPQALKDVPAEIRNTIYAETEPENIKKLDELKENIRKSGYPVLESYPAVCDPKAYDRPTKSYGRLIGLEAFGNSIEQQLREAIKAEHSLPEAPPLELEEDPLIAEKNSMTSL